MKSYSRNRILDEIFENEREYLEKLEDLKLIWEPEEIYCEMLDDGSIHAIIELY